MEASLFEIILCLNRTGGQARQQRAIPQVVHFAE
jgi:hypothetical protein